LDSQFKTNNVDLLRILAASQVVAAHTLWHLQIARPTWWSVGIPIAVLEAHASGLLIVSTALGTLGRLVRDGVNGHISRASNGARPRRSLLA
jgi:hypothetical protein